MAGSRRTRGEQVLGAHDLGDLAEHGAAARSDQTIGDAAERRDSMRVLTCSPSRRTSATAPARRRRTTRVPRADSVAAKRLRDARPCSVALTVPPSAWIATISTGFRCRRADVGQRLRHHLLAAKRDDEDGADVGMRAIGRQRLVRHAHVGAELAAARQMRQAPRRAAAPRRPHRSATTDAQITVGTTST